MATVPVGEIRVSVTKDRYFPAKASLTADAAREFVVRVEMQPQEEVKEEIKGYAPASTGTASRGTFFTLGDAGDVEPS